MRIIQVILLAQCHTLGVFFPGHLSILLTGYDSCAFPFRGVKVSALYTLLTFSIILFLILWPVPLIFCSRLYVHSSNYQVHIWKINKPFDIPQDCILITSVLGSYLILLQACGRIIIYHSCIKNVCFILFCFNSVRKHCQSFFKYLTFPDFDVFIAKTRQAERQQVLSSLNDSKTWNVAKLKQQNMCRAMKMLLWIKKR